MSVYFFERVDAVEMRESGGAFETLDEAERGVQGSYRQHPSNSVNEILARQDPRLSFRRRQAGDAWIVEVFKDNFDQGAPLATYLQDHGRPICELLKVDRWRYKGRLGACGGMADAVACPMAFS